MGEKRRNRLTRGGSNEYGGRSEFAWHPWWVWQLLRRNPFYINESNKFEVAISEGKCPTLRTVWRDLRHHSDHTPTNDFQILRRGFVELDQLRFVRKGKSFVVEGKVGNSVGADFPKVHHFEQILSLTRIFDRLTDDEKKLLSSFHKKYRDVTEFPLDHRIDNPQTGLLFTLFNFYPALMKGRTLDEGSCVALGGIDGLGLRTLQINLAFSDDFIIQEIKRLLERERESLANTFLNRFALMRDKKVQPKHWEEMFKRLVAYDLHSGGEKTVTIRDRMKVELDISLGNAHVQIPRYIKEIERLISIFNPPTPH